MLSTHERILPVSSVVGICDVVAQKEILAGGDGNGTAVEDAGFSRAGGDALDQGAAIVAKDHDISGAEFAEDPDAQD